MMDNKLISHKDTIRKLKKIIRDIEKEKPIGYPEQRICDQKVEEKIEDIVEGYIDQDVSNISLLEINKLIGLFLKCEKIVFFRKKVNRDIEKITSKLKNKQIKLMQALVKER